MGILILLVLSGLIFIRSSFLVECGVIGLHYFYWFIRSNRDGFEWPKSYILLSSVIVGLGMLLLLKSHQIESISHCRLLVIQRTNHDKA